jgi:hypothetical protein
MTAAASGIVLAVGNSATATGALNTDMTVPLNIDLTNRGSRRFSSITLTITFDPTKMQYRSNSAGTWVDSNGDAATVTINVNDASTGTIRITGFTQEDNALSATIMVLRNLVMRPLTAGSATITATVTQAGSLETTDILSSVTVRILTINTP